MTQDQYCWPFFFASDRENSTNVETQHEVLIDETLWNIRDAHVYRDVYRDSYPLQADRPLDERRARVSHTLDPHTFPKSTWTRKIITLDNDLSRPTSLSRRRLTVPPNSNTIFTTASPGTSAGTTTPSPSTAPSPVTRWGPRATTAANGGTPRRRARRGCETRTS